MEEARYVTCRRHKNKSAEDGQNKGGYGTYTNGLFSERGGLPPAHSQARFQSVISVPFSFFSCRLSGLARIYAGIWVLSLIGVF